MRDKKLAMHTYSSDGAQHTYRCHFLVDLPERCEDGINILPGLIATIKNRFKLRWCAAVYLVRYIDSGSPVQIKLVDHGRDSSDAHFQTEPIEITITRMSDGRPHVRRAVIAHTSRELVADGNPSAANEIGVIKRDRTLLQAGDRHGNLPR